MHAQFGPTPSRSHSMQYYVFMYILYIYIILIIIKGFLAAVALPPIFNINKKYEQEIKESKQLH